MKCLQIVGNSNYGGGGYSLIRWCEYLLSRGCQVDVLATDSVVVTELKKIPGLKVIESIYIPRDIAPTRDLRASIQLLLLLRREHYDVVHTYTATPSFLGRIAARLVGVPVILRRAAGWPVTDVSSLLERILYTPLEYLATSASTRAICVSHAMAQQARELRIAPQGKLVTVSTGIDPEPFHSAAQSGDGNALRRELGIPANCLVIGNAGRLVPSKENSALIRAMGSIEMLIPHTPCILLLAGEGPERKKLEDLVQSLNLGERVRFLGFRRDIPAFLAALDVFVSPTLHEGLSVSLLEAMAAAKPVITTSIPENAELIEHEVTGLLVPPKSPQQIAEAIARLVREPDLARRCANAARQSVLEHHTLERMLLETWNLYVDFLNENQLERVSA